MAPQRLRRRHGDAWPTRSYRWARRPVGRGAPPPPDVRRLCRRARRTRARRLTTRCPADPPRRPRLLGEWASTTTCRRSSACCSPTTALPWLMLYYLEMLPRVRAAGSCHAVAREGPWQCGCPWRANPARRAQLGRVGSGPARNAAVLEGLQHGHDAGRVGGACHVKEDQGPLLWCAWWSRAFGCFCPIWCVGGCKSCTLRLLCVVPEVAPSMRERYV